MSYVALYREWRPKTFDDVVEQTGVVKILKNVIKNDRIGHAYLFCGTRGTGKTSIAKIFSRAINCLNPQEGNPCNECEICEGILNGSLMDVIEIDAASNNSVDNVREIIEEINYVPTMAKYKVYIIDEVHMLSQGAFNALLKTLEEPPKYAVFILATTDPNKLPATILSRCQRYDFKRISQQGIISRLKSICDSNNVEVEENALLYIAQASDGAMRDAISILDQCLSLITDNKLTYDNILSILGVAKEEFTGRMVSAIINKDVTSALDLINNLLAEGKELPRFLEELILYFRNLLIVKTVQNADKLVFVTTDTLELMKQQSEKVTKDEIIFFIKELSGLDRDLKWSTQKKIVFEVEIIKLCTIADTIGGASLKSAEERKYKEPTAKSSISKGNMTRSSTGNNSSSRSINNKISNADERPDDFKTKEIRNSTSVRDEVRDNVDEGDTGVASGRPLDGADLRDIISELKNRREMRLLSYLRGVKAVYHSDKQVNLIFCGDGKEVKKEFMQEHKNFETISEVFNKVLQKEYNLKLFTEDEYNSNLNIPSDGPSNSSDQSPNLIDRLKKLEDAGVSVELL